MRRCNNSKDVHSYSLEYIHKNQIQCQNFEIVCVDRHILSTCFHIIIYLFFETFLDKYFFEGNSGEEGDTFTVSMILHQSIILVIKYVSGFLVSRK